MGGAERELRGETDEQKKRVVCWNDVSRNGDGQTEKERLYRLDSIMDSSISGCGLSTLSLAIPFDPR
jgi:hypothetical protein